MGLESTALLPERVLCLVAGPGPKLPVDTLAKPPLPAGEGWGEGESRIGSTPLSPRFPGKSRVSQKSPVGELVDAIDAAIQGGVNMVQLRDRISIGQAKTELAAAVRDVTRDRAVFVVNGDPELAARTGADGVHLPEAAMPVSRARQVAGPGILVGRSVHSMGPARSAAAEGADYVVAGTVYPSPTHPGGQAGGTAIIRDIVEVVDLPVIGIGGIDAANAARVIDAGARGVACISAILAAEDPRLAAAAISDAINQREPNGDFR